MKLRSKWTLGLASLAFAAMGSAMVATAQQTPTPAPTPQTKPQKGDTKPEEKHPRLQKAIEELREVKIHLEKAPHDFGGHKADAIKSVTEAIKQLEAAVKFDK